MKNVIRMTRKLMILSVFLIALGLVAFDSPTNAGASVCCESCEVRAARCDYLYQPGTPEHNSCIRFNMTCWSNCDYCGSGGIGPSGSVCVAAWECVSQVCTGGYCQ